MWYNLNSIKVQLKQIESDVNRLMHHLEKDNEWKDKVDSHLHEYNAQLKVHIEGVKELKENNKLLQRHIDNETRRIQIDLEPIKKHVTYVQITLQYVIVPIFVAVCVYLVRYIFV